MKHIVYILLILASLSISFYASAEQQQNTARLGSTNKITVFFDSGNKEFFAQYRDTQIKGDDIIVSFMFTNMSSNISPDKRLPGNKKAKIKITTYFNSDKTVIASKSMYPIDFYYQQEGYVRTGNSIPLYIHSGNLTKKQIESINTIVIRPEIEVK